MYTLGPAAASVAYGRAGGLPSVDDTIFIFSRFGGILASYQDNKLKMFPMLGPAREKKKKKKKVRLVEPEEESISSTQAIHQTSTLSTITTATATATVEPQTLIVISFITRLPHKKNQGQGTEILFYKPKHSLTPSESHHCAFKCIPRQTQATDPKWTFLFIEAGTLPETNVDELSLKSIKRHLSPPQERLIKVRNSKILRWDNHTSLASVLYRIHEIDSVKDIDDWIRINTASFYWAKIYGFHSAIENNLVSTALAAVSFPVAFNVGFEEIAHLDQHTRSDTVTLKALETLYLSVQAGYARDGFKFYPQSVEPLKKVGNSDRDFKRRIWAYWTEVLCWHLISCRPIYRVSISYAINKILAILKPEVRNEKVNVEELEKRMVEAIGIEADRCRQSIANIVKHAVFEILHLPPDPSTQVDSMNSIHLFTLGSSSATYEALSQLVKHFITQSKWKSGIENHGSSIQGLKITIAEYRPLHEGVILANKLNELINIYSAPTYPTKPVIDSKKAYPHLKNTQSLLSIDTFLESKDWYLDSKHQKVLESFEDRRKPSSLTGLFSNDPVIGQDGDERSHLGDLLQKVDLINGHQVQKEDKIKVKVELTTDVGFRSCLLSAGSTGVLLLAADRVLPNGDALCKLGSTMAAYTAHKLGQVVIILVRHDRVQPSEDDPLPASRPPSSTLAAHPLLLSGMIMSWKSVFKHEIIDHLARKVIIAPHPGSHLLGSDGFEIVKADWISYFITDSGKMGVERVKEVSDTLSSLHNLLWEENNEDH
ncbi:hypothetical protein MJO28_003422 [Puccinia striiformis f. sp. tritici]|uniref:Uncharacterized protein n=1 Tax=Puccinia striiformis f. sp. tritici TaxID=168172 RepID=A0ACC0EUD8_9BASI|nr:hypothetical protein Pst134EB_005739 [Puccinia striiformis f. sp. tritici]KAI7959631.1 hypothetical protein MJO28_003422 [Puccinia striiformis f. sp. tritici]